MWHKNRNQIRSVMSIGRRPVLETGDWWFESTHSDQFNSTLAQLVVRLTVNQRDTGSNPVGGANFKKRRRTLFNPAL